MTKLIIKETHETPAVSLDAESGILEIKGRSLADDIRYFYKPILSWIDNYKKHHIFNQIHYYEAHDDKKYGEKSST